jgi:DNA-binding SARP family transcriptional activator
VLAALALYPRGLALPELGELMGGEDAKPTALKVAISYLRHALEPQLAKGAPSAFVELTHERYRLVTGQATIDVQALEAALDAGDRATALALYRGNLLDEPFFHRYLEAEREQLRGRTVAAALALAAEKRGAGELAGAEAVLVRMAAIAQTDEAPYQALMDLYLACGLADKAKQAYWDCRKARKAHLGLPPSGELEAAYRAIATR